MEELNVLGRTIFNTFADISYWVIAAVTIKEIMKSIARHDTDAIIKALIGAAISYGGIFMVTRILDMIKGVMK